MAWLHVDKSRQGSHLENNKHVSFVKHYNGLILTKLIVRGFYIFCLIEPFLLPLLIGFRLLLHDRLHRTYQCRLLIRGCRCIAKDLCMLMVQFLSAFKLFRVFLLILIPFILLLGVGADYSYLCLELDFCYYL